MNTIRVYRLAAMAAALVVVCALCGCGSVAEASTCTATATIVPPWTGTPALPVDSGGQDASLRADLHLDSSHPLHKISAIVAPAAGHRALSERLPWFQVTDLGATTDSIGTAFELSADVGAYETEHRITLDVSRAAWVPPEGHKQWIRFDSEGGKDALAGLEVRGWVCE